MRHLYALAALAFICGQASAADKQRDPVRQTRLSLDSNHKNYANAAGQIADQQKRERMRACAEVLLEISPTKIAK